MATPYIHDESHDEKVAPEDIGNFDEENSDTTQELVPETVEDDTPEEYKGKSARELIAMHQEAQRFNGKQSSEVGELRKNVDALIQAQLAVPGPNSSVQPEEEETVDFFEDPDKAVDARISNHPAIKAAAQKADEYARLTAQTQLQAKHPDMNTLVADDGFLEWVKGSKIRTRLFQQAHTQYDFDAADELFSNWKERAELAQQTVAVEKQERKQAVKAANTGANVGAQGAARKKKYRRADIIRLMNDDPARYASLSDEILVAYKEGRVIT